uniref:Uncharacterized protein n=1 Tax=Oryza glumipatula TaxID=40148 RepID=A0A0D9ZBH7_9ORYZ
MRGLFRAGKHPSSVPAHAMTHPSSSSCSLRQFSSSYKFRGAARRTHAKASIACSVLHQLIKLSITKVPDTVFL